MTKFSVAILLPAATLLSAQQASGQVAPKPFEKILGTWKQLPPPEPLLLKVEPEGSSTKISWGCKKDGSCADTIATNYDDKKVKDSATPVWEDSFRKAGERTLRQGNYTGGKLIYTAAWQLSPDGEMLTVKRHYTDPTATRDVTNAYDRAGGPVSKDDPFVGFWKHNWNRSDALINVYAPKGDVFTFTGPEGRTSERNCDDQDHTQDAETGILYSCRFTDTYTEDLQFKKNGQVYVTSINKISDDGKKMVSTIKNAQGKTTSELHFEKIN